jgi:hypothetical protein
MDQPFHVHPVAYLGFAQQIHHALFQDTSPNTAEHMRLALALDDDAVNALQMQQPRQQQARRASPDDTYLCSFHTFTFLGIQYRLLTSV